MKIAMEATFGSREALFSFIRTNRSDLKSEIEERCRIRRKEDHNSLSRKHTIHGPIVGGAPPASRTKHTIHEDTRGEAVGLAKTRIQKVNILRSSTRFYLFLFLEKLHTLWRLCRWKWQKMQSVEP